MLSAYALSGEPSLLRHAERIGQILLPAFNGTESGLPAYSVNVETYAFFPKKSFISNPNFGFLEVKFFRLVVKQPFFSQNRRVANLSLNTWRN